MVRVGIAVLLCACGRIGFDTDPGDCDTPTMWFTDADGDGHGDPAAATLTCLQPPMTSDKGDDCDDDNRFRHPGAPEVCDGIDNDCDPMTDDACPIDCEPQRRPPPDDAHHYLICNMMETWMAARDRCASLGYALATVDDASENAFLAGTASQQWIGASDLAAEAAWTWLDGTLFWDGDATGGPVGGRFEAWKVNEPNDSDPMGEDCAEVLDTKEWNDTLCIATRTYVCEL